LFVHGKICGKINQFLTDDEIIEELVVEEKDDDGYYNNKGEEVAVQTITHSTAIDSFTMSITWAEGNGVDTCDILVLKQLQEKVLKVSFQTKKQKKINNFFKSVLYKY
jgi:hypothetical protein